LLSLEEFAHVGSVLADKYLVEGIVAKGGMALVLAARRLCEKDRVAIKLPLPNAAKDPRLAERFLREAGTARRVGPPHAPRVLDMGVRPDGTPYFVMELLEGETLAERLARSGPLPAQEAVVLLRAACTAVSAVHALGVIHRDLKPANLFLELATPGTTTIKLLDFGIAIASTDSGCVDPDPWIGSLPYMSPEQLTAPARVDARSDLWSLGVVLYECLAGQSPFQVEPAARLCAGILQEPLAPLPLRQSDVPRALERIARRCLAKRPERRFVSVSALARELARLAPVAGRGAQVAARSARSAQF
jgi:serine/threonine-protein kinase